MHKLQIKYEKEINELVEATVRLGELGFVTSHGGNLSYRVDEDAVLITPTKVSKRKVVFDDIVIINLAGEVMFAGDERKPTGEMPVHLNILKKRPDIRGLVHAHPPVLTGFALSSNEILSRPLLPEPIIELGPVLYVNYEEPISDKLAASFDEVIYLSNTFLMKNHGVMICNPEGVERALELLEMLEAMAYSVFVASLLGKVNEIPAHEVENLENTLRTREIPIPGKPGYVKRLIDFYFCEKDKIENGRCS